MPSERTRPSLAALLRNELRYFLTFHPSPRPWQMPIAAALASGVPLLIGAYFDRLAWGLVSSIGGLTFLYLPSTALHHRMPWIMTCAFGMAACHALGLLTHFVPGLAVPMITLIGIVVMMLVRYYSAPPPGGMFFMMAAAIGAFSPLNAGTELPLRVGLITLGTVWACLVAFVYSLEVLRHREPLPPPKPNPDFGDVVLDGTIIGITVGLSLAIAIALRLERPYWVPISCLAVIQGVTLRAVWTRQLQRIAGTGAGVLLAGALLSLPLDKWSIGALIMVLTLVIESVVVRNYALGAMFFTPLAILLAEAPQLGHVMPAEMLLARFLDTVLGSLVGLAGGICLHNERFREVVGGWMRRLGPVRRAKVNDE